MSDPSRFDIVSQLETRENVFPISFSSDSLLTIDLTVDTDKEWGPTRADTIKMYHIELEKAIAIRCVILKHVPTIARVLSFTFKPVMLRNLGRKNAKKPRKA